MPPTHAGECVLSKANTAMPTLYAQEPICEIAIPLNNQR